MPRKISADIDMQILADIGLGMIYKDVAAKHGVSPSYITKLTSGKKTPDIRIPEPTKLMSEDFESFKNDIDDIVNYIDKKRVLVSNDDVIKFLRTQVHKSVVRIKIYLELINKYEGEK